MAKIVSRPELHDMPHGEALFWGHGCTWQSLDKHRSDNAEQIVVTVSARSVLEKLCVNQNFLLRSYFSQYVGVFPGREVRERN
jgi:hypothetical protein